MAYQMNDLNPNPYAAEAAANRARFLDIYRTHITREGADKLLAFLESSRPAFLPSGVAGRSFA